MDLAVSDRVRIRFRASDRIAEAVAEHQAFLKQELLADEIERADAAGEPVTIGGEAVDVVVERTGG